MALPSGTVWEVRTTGSDSNGGGFVAGSSGTDFSQQNSAQYTFADLASSNGTSGSPQVTSASHNFVAADVGNLIHVTAGTNWTTGFYQIVSVAANAATLDRAVGSAASLSAGTYAVGGALLTIGTAQTNGTRLNVIYIQSGTYTLTATINSGAATAPTFWIGYHTARGDHDGTRPLVTTATNSTPLVILNGSSTEWLQIDNVNFSNTAGTRAFGIVTQGGGNNNLVLQNCHLTGFTDALNGDNVGADTNFGALTLINCEIDTCSNAAVNMSNTISNLGLCIFNSYIHNNTNGGVAAGLGNQGATEVIAHSIFDSNGGIGCQLRLTGFIRVINSNFTNNGTDGLRFDDGGISNPPATGSIVVNSIFYGNGGFGLNSVTTGSSSPYGRKNAFGNNTSGPTSGIPTIPGLIEVITLTANPFTSSTNFALNATAGGGAACGGTGAVPSSSSSSPNSINVGAIQTSSGGAMGGLLGRPVMSGGMFG